MELVKARRQVAMQQQRAKAGMKPPAKKSAKNGKGLFHAGKQSRSGSPFEKGK